MWLDLDKFDSPINVYGREHQKEGYAVAGIFGLISVIGVSVACWRERKKTREPIEK